MKVLVTGANGYIGARLIPLLKEEGHEVFAFIRSVKRVGDWFQDCTLIEGDLLNTSSLERIPSDIDAAYYLVHSMSYSKKFHELEALSAQNFQKRIGNTNAKQIIYLSGLSNEERLSRHLLSRLEVGKILQQGRVPVTVLMAGIVIGSGSASFEIIRDLVEKLPLMVAPKWVNNLTQPIAIRNVLEYLTQVLGKKECIGKSFEIGGPDVMTYKELLLRFSKKRGFKRFIFTVPVLTPRLSSYWLYFVTSTTFSLARFLVESLKNNAVCKEHEIRKIIPIRLLFYEEALDIAFSRIDEDWVPSSWKDSMSGSFLNPDLTVYLQVPRFGVLKDIQMIDFQNDIDVVQKNIWSIGGKNGWLAMNWAWQVRGFIDKLFGGIGLRRGRTHPTQLKTGDALDFWRVLLADEKQRRLLLYAEMKLPGEAWLEFKIFSADKCSGTLLQIATFRPKGLLGRVYWWMMWPFHFFLFRKMAKKLVRSF